MGLQYILIPIAVSIMFGLIAVFRKKEDKKQENSDVFYIRAPKFVTVFFFVFVVLGVVGGIVGCIVFRNDQTALIVIPCLGGFFALLGLLGYVFVRSTYVLVDGDKVVSHRIFRKTVEYTFDDIAYFKISIAFGGDVSCYDKNNKKICTCEPMFTGYDLMLKKLREKGVMQKPSKY